MVIIKQVSGQLANRLHFFSYFVANSRAYDYALLITCFPEYYDLFTPIGDDGLKVTFTKRGILPKLFNKVLNGIEPLTKKINFKFPGLIFHSIPANDLQMEQYDINSDEFIKLAKRKIVMPQGWVYRDYVNLKKYLPQVKNLFSPKIEFREVVKATINTARSMGEVVIGVHIRRGDYIDFNDGKWFYDNSVYKNKMRQVEQLFNSRQCIFIICSQETLNQNEFAGFVTLIAERPAVVDLYLLAECDYIMGPPSTFTGWASLYNTVPAYYIQSADEKVNAASFKEFFD